MTLAVGIWLSALRGRGPFITMRPFRGSDSALNRAIQPKAEITLCLAASFTSRYTLKDMRLRWPEMACK